MYLEVVAADVAATCALFEAAHGLTFGPPDADLGGARVASRTDGSLVGVRAPLAAHEVPIVRAYLAVSDIGHSVAAAAAAGGMVAYGPTLQGARGTFAIVIAGGAQLGFWQRP